MKKLVTVLLALAMAFTMVFATAASAEDGYKDSITWVIGNDQDILDPQNDVSNSKVIPQYYNGLLGYDNDGNVVCKIAESYEASEDKMTWTFHLRQDVYFHSGRHCTARAKAFSQPVAAGSNSPTISPRLKTMTRSATWCTSSNSLEMMRTPSPSRAMSRIRA